MSNKTAEEALKDTMFMNGGNTDAEKDFFALGFKQAFASSQSGSVCRCEELEKENEMLTSKEAIKELREENERLRRFVGSLASWTEEQCGWPDAGIRARGSARNLLNNLSTNQNKK